MRNIGILAYGSLIEDPGIEIGPLIAERISGIQTPFKIEFARSSRSRGGAPTVIPVEESGAQVIAVILVLKAGIDIEQAKDLLWRRETRNENSRKHYSYPCRLDVDKVFVDELTDFGGVNKVLYTKIGANIDRPTAKKLADLAIESARGKAGDIGRDGISYLMSLKRFQIFTPLMNEYEHEILTSVGASTLSDALSIVRSKAIT